MKGPGARRAAVVLLAAFVWAALAHPAGAVEVGQKAPDFSLLGTTAKPVRLSQYAGKQVVVLHFYLGDFLEAWEADLASRRDGYAKFKAAGAEIIGVSVDPPAKHRQFQAKLGLPFPLLSDETRRVIKRYGVLDETWNLAKRSYFIIDRRGVVRFKKVFDNPAQLLTNDELLAEVRRLAE